MHETLDLPPDARTPSGPIAERWEKRRFQLKLVNPANRRRYTIIIVGSGLAGGAAAATLGEAGYNVLCFCFQDSPRRAHSIAAQGGINAAKNYRNDGDSVHRLFYDTIKGGDYRSREANVHRLAEVSANIIDQCVAQGVPFAREYGGLLSNRSFGGTQVQRTFYAAGQTGQQLLIGAYQALERQIALGNVEMYTRHEMLDGVVIDGKGRGIIARNLINGELEIHFGDAGCVCTGGYGVGSSKQAVYLDYASAIERYGKIECRKHSIENPSEEEIRQHGVDVVKEKYGNLFDMYNKITGEDPYSTPMRIYPAVHYTMG